MDAVCRIYLFTYKRNHLLKRSIDSLINQTLRNWICELHNDDPTDSFPEAYLKQLNDHRFIIKNHSENLGGPRSFNLAFAGCTEKFVSILEDDNWWEADFLEQMTGLLTAHSNVDIAWSNMRLWAEQDNGDWLDTGNTIWPESVPTFFNWGHPKQLLGHLHSNGAMVYRAKNASHYIIPDNTLLNAIEPVRERTFRHPLVLNSQPLANFAITRQTNRSGNPYHWIAFQMMLLASFVQTSANPAYAFKSGLSWYRHQNPNPVGCIFLANLFLLKQPLLYRLFSLSDWIAIAAWLVKRGRKLPEIRRYISGNYNIYTFLLEKTNQQHAAG